jgi:hypothetical protein
VCVYIGLTSVRLALRLFSYDSLEPRILARGYTKQQLEKTLEEYESLNVIQVPITPDPLFFFFFRLSVSVWHLSTWLLP